MSDQEYQNEELDALQEGLPGLGLEADTTLKPIDLKDIIDEIAPSGVKVDAKTVVGEPFVIIRAKPFPSRFPPQTHAYYVVGADKKTGELFNTVLGGTAVCDVLDALTRAKRSEPITVTLGWVEGGRYGGYYTLS